MFWLQKPHTHTLRYWLNVHKSQADGFLYLWSGEHCPLMGVGGFILLLNKVQSNIWHAEQYVLAHLIHNKNNNSGFLYSAEAHVHWQWQGLIFKKMSLLVYRSCLECSLHQNIVRICWNMLIIGSHWRSLQVCYLYFI